MGGGPLAMLPMALQLGSKLFGGSAQAATGGGAAPTPFDAIVNPAAAPPAPPPPPRNPMFSGGIDEGPAPAAKPVNAPPMPGRGAPGMPGRNPMFSGGIDNAPPMPQPHPMQGGLAQGSAYVPGELTMNEDLTPTGAPNVQTAYRTPPAATDPYAAAKAAGYTTDTVYASQVNAGDVPPKTRPAEKAKTPQGLFGSMEEPETEPKDAPVQANTLSSKPAPEKQDLTEDDGEESLDMDGEPEEPGLIRKYFGGEAGDFFGNLQDKLGDSATNPMFQAGMGLLASGHDGSNPWTQMLRGLSAVPGHQIAAQSADLAVNADQRAGVKAEKDQKDQAQQDQLAALLAAIGAKYGAQGPMTPQSAVARGAAKVVR